MKSDKLSLINQFLDKFSISKKAIIYILSLMIVSAGFQVVSAGLLPPFLNSLQNKQTEGPSNKFFQWTEEMFSGVDKEDQFIYILITILGIMTIVQALTIVINREIAKFSMFTVQESVARNLFKDILSTKIKFFYQHQSGTLINNITVDIERVNTALFYLLKITCYGLFALAYIAVGLWTLPVYTMWLMGVLVVLYVAAKFLMPYMFTLGKKDYKARMDSNNIIVETIQGIRTVMLSCAQERLNQRFEKTIRDKYTSVFSSGWISATIPTGINLLVMFLIAAVLFINRDRILLQNSDYFSQIIFFVYIAGNIFLNIGRVNQMYSFFTFNLQSLKVLIQLQDELKIFQQENDEEKIELNRIQDELKIVNMGFAYKEGVQVIHSLDFTIGVNKKIAFVGSSGSGKSTLIDLISGFHDDYTGSILIDGVELRDIRKQSWRNLLGYVSQETFIFNDTVRNNITFGFDRAISDEELHDACKKAQIYDTIVSFPKQFDTELGERGIRLSGGEKQRLAIARLFIKNPPVILLDEATSALDSEAEIKVKTALGELGKGRTVIAIAHRLSTISDFDYIYVLEDGSIIESGTHAELILQRGRYFTFYNIQSMEMNYA